MKTILLTGGGTAGHVTPNLTLLPDLKKHFDKVVYVGSESGIEKRLAKEHNLPYASITTCKFVRKKFFKNLGIPFKLAKGVRQAKEVLKETKPSVVFSKGGYVSVPVVLAAKKLHIPVVAHESDLSPGLANKLCANKCQVVFTSFPQTAQKLKNGKFSGPPLPAPTSISKEEAKERLGASKTLPLLLVTGGSQGAQALNKVVEQALPQLVKHYFVYHQTGKGNKTSFTHKNYKQVEFESNMPLAMRAADLCITRGGSNSIFELAQNQVPMLIIPLPKGGSRGDQEENAAYFSSEGLAKVLPQAQLSTTSLTESLSSLQQSSKQIQQQQANFSRGFGTKAIVQTLVSLAK